MIISKKTTLYNDRRRPITRTSKSVKNIRYALIGQAVGLIISFIARIAFVKILGSDYLGLNGLFTNILSILSLAELGVGTAITYSLYEPLAKNDTEKCKTLMRLYQRVYIVIGIVILALGALLIPFLPYLISDIPDIPSINLIYYLFVINTAVSYFFSYKRNLIIADQNRYIATFYRYLLYFFLNLAQIVFLLIAKDYIVFLLLQIFFTLLENIIVSRRANRLYSFLKEKKIKPLTASDKKTIIKNTRAMLMHKIGGVMVSSTDNILLSSIINLAAVAKYSNYSLITSALDLITVQFYSSTIASVGNLCIEANEEIQYDIFKKINFMTFWIFSFCSVCLLCLLNPFIELWVGSEFLFSMDIVLVLVINFFITGMRKTVLMFREATGLFYKDRWKAVIEAVVNLVISIILGKIMGIIGIFIGTFISSITVCVWVEPYVMFKYGFKRPLWDYFKKYIKYCVVAVIVTALTFLLCSFMTLDNKLFALIIKGLICAVIPNFVIWLIFRRTSEFRYLKAKIITPVFNKIAARIWRHN